MVQFLSSNTLDPSVYQIEDVYEALLPPPLIISAAPAHTAGLVGTASWGPVNIATPIGSINQLNQVFGALGTPALTDSHDLVTDGWLALTQGNGQKAAMSLVGVRVTDGTDVAASATMVDTGAAALVSVSSIYTGVAGNAAQVITTAGNATGTTNVSVVMPGLPSESYTSLPNATFQTAFVNAITLGQSGIRPPSQLIKASLPVVAPLVATSGMFTPSSSGGAIVAGTYRAKVTITNAQGETIGSNEISSIVVGGTSLGSIAVNITALPTGGVGFKVYLTAAGGATGTELLALTVASGTTGTVIAAGATTPPPTANTATILNTVAPALATLSLSGGLDGRSVNTSQLTGADFNVSTSAQATGAYALRGQKCSTFAISGLTDTTAWAGLVPLCASENMSTFFQMPSGTTTTAAITTKNSVGANNFQVHMINGDFALWQDPINNVTRAVPCTGIFAGARASLGFQFSIGNTPVYGIVGTTRTTPYTNTEISLLSTNGITFITMPIPAGNFFGIRVGRNTAPNLSTAASEYTSVTNFLVASIGAGLGPYVDNLQSAQDTDALRQAITTSLDQFLQGLVDNHQLDSFQVTCNLTNNTPSTIAAHQLYAFVSAKYLSSAMFIVVQIQGGSTVNVSPIQVSL